ncbi:MAG: hypothetical protein WC511_02185 [Candidatus Pacearchaeota archaeon]
MISRYSKLAKITDEFKKLIQTFKTESIYKTPAFKKKKKYLEILRHGSEENGWFYYVQRLGKNSVAFVLYDPSHNNEFGILKSYSSPYKKFIVDAFTGSLDKPELSVEDIVIEEVKEEAGYTVNKDRLKKTGEYLVGTSTDETVYGFLIDVNRMPPEKKDPENLFEANMDTIWTTFENVMSNPDIGWRAKMILQDAKNKGIV